MQCPDPDLLETDLRANKPRDSPRNNLELAADIGITAFSSAEPNEFYWPPTNRRLGCDPSANEGLLECFGVRDRYPLPGTEYDSLPAMTKVYISPQYNDSGEYEGGRKGEDACWSWWHRAIRGTPNGEPNQAILDERTKREEELESFRRGARYEDFPGWEGGSSSRGTYKFALTGSALVFCDPHVRHTT